MATTRNVFGVVVILACVLVSVCGAADRNPSGKKIRLRILYFGHPDSPRERDFVAFLCKHFKDVQTGDLAEFEEARTKGFDVVILDHDAEGFKGPWSRATISRQYTRPTVTVGVPGSLICESLRLKMGYL